MKKSNLKSFVLSVSLFLYSNFCIGQTGASQNQGKPDILDSFIAITIILFILSVIVEKITQLLRKYSPFIKPHYNKNIRNSIGTVWRNINNKQKGNDSELDKRIEREVNSLSLIIGLLVALAFRVDLFKMFKSADPRDVLFWSDSVTYSPLEKLLFALSIGLTGFFLTFGSKFFHDLLDTLFQVKTLKRKAADENTFKAESIEQFDEFMSKSNASIIDMAIQQNQSLLNSPDIIAPPMQGKMMKEGKLVDCIDIHVSSTSRGKIPFAVQAKLEKGQIVTVPVNVITEVDIPQAHSAQGNTVANVKSPTFMGTICCRLKRKTDNKIALLTCSHVMTNKSNKNFFGTLTPVQKAQVSGQANGSFFWAVRNDAFDLALLAPADDSFQYQINPGKERALTSADILTTDIKIVRQDGRGIGEGKIVNNRATKGTPITYKEGEISLFNLIILSNVSFSDDDMSFSSLTSPGDSGACVYDSQNRPIGMIVAGNNKFSYAVPMIDILVQTESSIIA